MVKSYLNLTVYSFGLSIRWVVVSSEACISLSLFRFFICFFVSASFCFDSDFLVDIPLAWIIWIYRNNLKKKLRWKNLREKLQCILFFADQRHFDLKWKFKFDVFLHKILEQTRCNSASPNFDNKYHLE